MFILKNMLHVLELKNNFISLGILDSTSFSFKCKHDQIMVCKDSLVIFYGKQRNKLHILNGVAKTEDGMGTH